MPIGQNARPGRDHGLHIDAVRHDAMALRKVFFDARPDGGVQRQRAAKQLRDEVARHVVRSRPQTSCCQHQICAAQRLTRGSLNGGAVIGHAYLPGDFVAVISQLAANPLLVRIEHAPQKQFTAGVDEFNMHREL